MKLTIASFFTFLTTLSFSQDFNGVWADSSSTSFGNCYAIFSVQNDSVFMTHYAEFNGNPFVEHGEGIVIGNKLQYSVVVTTKVPGWETTAGKHVLVLSNDKKTLRGTYSDNTGNSGPLVFKKQFPKK